MKNLIFLADENIPKLVIKELRKSGHNIISVAENYKGSSDEEILDLSSKNRWIILTFDKDFGDLIYKQKFNKPLGIILLRIAPKSVEYILQLLKWLLSQPDIYFEGNFVVMNSDRLELLHFYSLISHISPTAPPSVFPSSIPDGTVPPCLIISTCLKAPIPDVMENRLLLRHRYSAQSY